MTAPPQGRRALEVELHGVRLHLLAGRGVWLPETRTLFIADLHAGKDEALRAAGMPIPPGVLASDLGRLLDMVTGLGAGRLIVLGDFLHARRGRTPGVEAQLLEWRSGLPGLQVVVVRGNHDRSAGDPSPELGIQVVPEGVREGPLLLRHEPPLRDEEGAELDSPPPLTLAGHLHPAWRIGPGVRTPGFWYRSSTLVLPAFSEFTSGVLVDPAPKDRCWAIAPPEVVEFSPTAVARLASRARGTHAG